jgi:hypothetical protein
MDRQPGKLLDSCDKEGAVKIRRRNGKSYTLRPDEHSEIVIPNFSERVRAIFPEVIPEEITEAVDKLIAGE